jgi:hypothetical protein
MTTNPLQPDDLPLWMRPRRRVIDWGLLLILGFSVLIAGALITGHTVLRRNDTELAAFRSLEVARLVRSGLLFSRWAPDLNTMFGSPLFNYLAPLPHYLPGYHQALTEVSPAASVNLFLALSIIAAGTGMYLFARQRWGAPAGMVAALVYVFSPPVALTLPYYTGDLAPLMALGLLPWALWSIDWLWVAPRSLSLVLAAALTSAFVLADARIACLGGPVIGVALASLRSLPGSSPGRGSVRPVLIAIFATLMLTTFFWMPALAERDQINWIAGTPDVRAGPITLTESLGGLPRPDAQILNPPVYRGSESRHSQSLPGANGIVWRARRKAHPSVCVMRAISDDGLILLAISRRRCATMVVSTDFRRCLSLRCSFLSSFGRVGARSITCSVCQQALATTSHCRAWCAAAAAARSIHQPTDCRQAISISWQVCAAS